MTGAGSSRQQHKLQKKLDRKHSDLNNTEATERQTRRRRFLDPDSSFGKQSLVYKLKHGVLRDRAAMLDIPEPESPAKTSHRYDRNRRAPDSGTRIRYENHAKKEDGRPRQRDTRTNATQGGDALEATPTRKKMLPMRIHYTTAASQFLYGRSVVRAALERSRRRLYRLYIYGGENRKDSKENDLIEALAKAKRVPITLVPAEDQRLMDKMSLGRPHNGFVLEASPLPNVPVKSLGRLVEHVSKMGFHVERDFQTKEEKSINGMDTFMTRVNNNTPKPLVLLLHEILDPGNLGGLFRTASYLGVDAVAVTNRSSSTLTPVVLKSAAGAAEEIPVLTVADPVKFLEDSGKAGWKTYAAVAPPEKKLADRHADKFITTGRVEAARPLDQDPCILVLGNEGYGLPKQVKLACDYELSVPRLLTGSTVDSLNVGVAAGLLCHAFVRERLPSNAGGESSSRLETGQSVALGDTLY